MLPIEGRDLNPILQDVGLAIHPPLLYLGYVGFSIAFAFPLRLCWKAGSMLAWARWVRPWVIVAWGLLTLVSPWGLIGHIMSLAGVATGSGIPLKMPHSCHG